MHLAIIDFRFTYGNTNQFFNAWEAYFVGSAAYNYIFGDLQWLIGQDISDGYAMLLHFHEPG